MTLTVCIGSSCHLKGSEKIVELARDLIIQNGVEDDVILSGCFCAARCNRTGVTVSLTSKMCCIFLEKMLSAGCSVALSLEMLNNFMRGRNLECFSTIDLLQIDLIEKRAVFVKSGAAPSYVYRDGSLFKITSNSMPVGITREINAEEIRFDLKEGDIVIMTSDGVAQSFDDTAWLSELVCMDWEDHLQHMADKILHSAEQRSRRGDDISVGLIRLDAVPSAGAARAS